MLVFLLYRSKSKWMRIVDYLLMLASMVCIGYWIMNFEVINYCTGAETDLDMSIAMVGVLIGIELARRVVGNVFVILGILMLLYGSLRVPCSGFDLPCRGHFPRTLHQHLLQE
ncbi:MAG: hypothetical protein VXW26_00440 [SAR324 cluster bacterium]|nr:hypothetical protein [SAR324 cluster bacterium]